MMAFAFVSQIIITDMTAINDLNGLSVDDVLDLHGQNGSEMVIIDDIVVVIFDVMAVLVIVIILQFGLELIRKRKKIKTH